MFSDADLQVNENEVVPRPEEERITQAEKNQRLQAQLKVSTYIIVEVWAHCEKNVTALCQAYLAG